MTEHCRFLSKEGSIYGHNLRQLEITCENGFVGNIYVTREPAIEEAKTNFILKVWHYDISDDGSYITLTGVGNNSVNFAAVIPESCHSTVTNWPLIKD